jgi:hypothetical protein
VELTSAGADHVTVAGEEDVRDAILDLTDGLVQISFMTQLADPGWRSSFEQQGAWAGSLSMAALGMEPQRPGFLLAPALFEV